MDKRPKDDKLPESTDHDECRVQICRLRVAYMHLYKQYLDLDNEFRKLIQMGDDD